MMTGKARRIFFALALAAGLSVPGATFAETLRILAVGASNTNGKGVSRSTAWPARLQANLKDAGVDAKVTINAVNGSTTTQMLARLKRAIAAKPDVVILSIPLTNDRRRKVNTTANVEAMENLLEKNGIKLVLIPRPHLWAGHQMQNDRIHFNAAGHKTYAEKTAQLVLQQLNQQN